MSDDSAIRLAKYVAAMLPCSRREAEIYIEGGWITVDGEVVEQSGARVTEGQKVLLLPGATLLEIAPVTILLNKPPGYRAGARDGVHDALVCVTAGTWKSADHGNQRFLSKHLKDQQLMLPLDTDGSGLVVYTQDYRVVRKLVDEAFKIEQEFIVDVSGTMHDDGLARLNQTVSLDGRPLGAMKVSWQNETRLRFAIKNPHPGQIVKICQTVGLHVEALRRIRIGRVPMSSLPVGNWRYLHEYERF